MVKMKQETFHSILPPSQTKPKSQNRWGSRYASLTSGLAVNFNFTTILLFGALSQSILLLLPVRPIYTATPAIGLLLIKLFDTMAITYKWRPNPYLEGVVFKKASAQVPDLNGSFLDKAGSEKITVLFLGAKCNHPMGIFEPSFGTLGEYVEKMTSLLDGGKEDNGFLGQSAWFSRDKNGALEVNLISYWRDIAALHVFAHGSLHREAWQWWEKNLNSLDHIGINHEIYSCEPGQWENVYANFQPTGLGATSYLKKGDKLVGGVVSDEWISPLVQANRGQLRTSAGRLGWAPATQHDKYGPNVYE